MADINPAFDTQAGNPLPVLFGYGNGSGFAGPAVIDITNNRFGFFLGFDGECDGPEQMAYTAKAHLYIPPLRVGGGSTPYDVKVAYPAGLHFHSGAWTPIGIGNAAVSTGGDQGFDAYFAAIPSVTPPQSFSNICYWAIEIAYYTPFLRGNVQLQSLVPLAPYGIFRGARCRYFDANGNVSGYGFTTNPTWHMVEAILRFKVKRQQPQIAGLTDAEKACFNWPTIVQHAARNDARLPNGYPRYMGNYVFAAQATLASMLETMLRCCCSYIDDQDGKIGFYGYDAVDSSFALTADHVLDGTFQVAKKDLTRAPNVFVPKFRDLDIPALIKVNSATNNNAGAGPVGSTTPASIPQGAWEIIFDTGGVNPFVSGDMLFYGDSSNPQLNNYYGVNVNFDETVNPLPVWANGLPNVTATALGGYIGTLDSRFAKRAPATVQHRRHQLAAGQVSPGIPALPNVVPVEYDLGNMTYDQANRLMKYEMNSTLGNDAAGWTPPKTGSMKVRLDAVDANGNAFVRMRPNQRFTVDDTVSPEFAGDYLIDPQSGGITIIPPSSEEPLGALQVNFKTYNPDATTDVSDPPDDSLRTIASAALLQLGTSQSLANVGWVIQATPQVVTTSGSKVTVNIPDLTIQLLGQVGFTTLPNASWPGLTSGSPYILYVDMEGVGATPSFGSFAGALPLPVPVPLFRYVVLSVNFLAQVGAA